MRLSISIFFASLLFLTLSSCENNKKKVLPVLGDYDIVYKTVNGKEVTDTVHNTVPNFSYINQDSVWKEKSDFHGKLLVVDFIYTHCPDICPPMTSNMNRMNKATQDISKHVQFLSFSIDPKRDTPTRLREYIAQMGVTANNWQFLTGDEEATKELAMEFFKVGVEKGTGDDEAEFIHGDHIVLVDTSGYVRGLYSGTQMDQVDELEQDIRKLLKYEYGISSKKKK